MSVVLYTEPIYTERHIVKKLNIQHVMLELILCTWLIDITPFILPLVHLSVNIIVKKIFFQEYTLEWLENRRYWQ